MKRGDLLTVIGNKVAIVLINGDFSSSSVLGTINEGECVVFIEKSSTFMIRVLTRFGLGWVFDSRVR